MIDITMQGLEQVKKDFREMQKRIGTPKVMMDALGGQGMKNVVQHFGAEEGPLGPWKPLKHPRRSGGGGILKDTGRLRAATRFRTVNSTEAHVFNQTTYAAVHNFGSFEKNIPQRKFMWVDPKTRETMRKAMIRWVLKGMAN